MSTDLIDDWNEYSRKLKEIALFSTFCIKTFVQDLMQPFEVNKPKMSAYDEPTHVEVSRSRQPPSLSLPEVPTLVPKVACNSRNFGVIFRFPPSTPKDSIDPRSRVSFVKFVDDSVRKPMVLFLNKRREVLACGKFEIPYAYERKARQAIIALGAGMAIFVYEKKGRRKRVTFASEDQIILDSRKGEAIPYA